MIPQPEGYCADMGEWSQRNVVADRRILVEVALLSKEMPYPECRATLDGLNATRA